MKYIQNKYAVIGLLALFTLLLIAPISLAEEQMLTYDDNSPPQVGQNIGTGDFLASIIKVILALIVIIGLFFIIIKFLSQKNSKWFNQRSIKLLGGIQLGQNKSLQVIELGSSLYIIGVGDDVRMVDKIEQPEEVEMILNSFKMEGSATHRMLSIQDWLGRLKKSKDTNLSESTAIDDASFQDIFDAKIKTMSDRKKTIEQLISEHRQEER